MPAPFFDNGWNWTATMRRKAEAGQKKAARAADAENSAGRIVWEVGLVLAVPLAGAALVDLVLSAFHVF
jgi:hypothetical protein